MFWLLNNHLVPDKKNNEFVIKRFQSLVEAEIQKKSGQLLPSCYRLDQKRVSAYEFDSDNGIESLPDLTRDQFILMFSNEKTTHYVAVKNATFFDPAMDEPMGLDALTQWFSKYGSGFVGVEVMQIGKRTYQ